MRRGVEADERNACLASNRCRRGEDGLCARSGRTGVLCPRFGDTGASFGRGELQSSDTKARFAAGEEGMASACATGEEGMASVGAAAGEAGPAGRADLRGRGAAGIRACRRMSVGGTRKIRNTALT
jgi:hypothetical protein